jgi:hypothetical protein
MKRTVRDALRRWTTAVINVKLRELEVAQQYDLSAQMSVRCRLLLVPNCNL